VVTAISEVTPGAEHRTILATRRYRKRTPNRTRLPTSLGSPEAGLGMLAGRELFPNF